MSYYCLFGASLVAQMVQHLLTMKETWVQSLGQEDPLEKGMDTPVFLPREFHRQRNLAGCSPWSRKEWDTTERLHFHFGVVHLYGWVPLLTTWNYHNTVNRPWKVKVLVYYVWLFLTPWTVAHEAPLSMGFSSQEYWSELPGPSPGNLPKPGIWPGCHALQADSLLSEPTRQ